MDKTQMLERQGAIIRPGFVNPAFLTNPFPIFEMLRSSSPLYRFDLPNGRAVWLVTKIEDAVQILKDSRFSSAVPRMGMEQGAYDQNSLRLDRTMLFTEGLDHTRLRALVSRGFTPHFIAGLRPSIEAIAQNLLDVVQAKGEMDLMNDFAYPLPINVISNMLGFPTEDQDQIRDWSNALGDPMSTSADRHQKINAFAAYVQELIEQKRRQPANDLISSLVEKSENGDVLTDHELLGMISLLIFVGHETTASLIGNGMLALLTHPDQLEKLKADSSLIPGAIEELLRYCGPVLATVPRFVTEDVVIGEHTLHKGDIVNVILASTNRDTSQFTEPDELNVARQIEHHFAFGHGVHYCLGAPLARLESQIAFSALLSRLPNIVLNADPAALTWRGNLVLRGLESLPVKF